METIEITGDSIEEAIATGLEQLGVGPNDVMVEVLEEPSRGIFGIGARPARVRLRLFAKRPVPPPIMIDTAPTDEVGPEDDEEDLLDPTARYHYVDDAQLDEVARVGRDVLLELMKKMRINGQVKVRRADSGREAESTPWILNIASKDARRLIGRRGETLASLQYILRLIVSRQIQRRTDLIVDVGEYKAERSDRLRRLANRMADQAVKQGRTVTLEPMPPNERRIIHLTLRNRKDVETKSVGEGNARKVTIVPSSK